MLLRKELWRRGLRYRKNYKELYGKPDIVFLGARIAVFVDGKMWHGYNVKTISRLSKIIRDLLESQEVKERRNGIIKMIYKINIDNDYVKSIVNFQELLNSPFPILLTVIERRDFIARAENHYRRSLTFHSLNVAVGK